MRFLIDTNVLISSEPSRHDDVDAISRVCLDLASTAAGQHQLMVHPTVSDEIAHDRDPERRRLRQLVLNRYPTLEQPPSIQPSVEGVLGRPEPGSHDWFDHLLLACVVGDAVHGLITQDEGILRKARRLGLADRVHTVSDASAMLARLVDAPVVFVPSVDRRPMHGLDLHDTLFDSLRRDYPGFDEWFTARARDGRAAFVIEGADGRLAGVCIVKPDDDEIGLGGRVAKVSTFKVADEYKGNRYGELLLKALFRSVEDRDAVWLTVFEKQEALISLLETFGFAHHDTHRGEQRWVKVLHANPGGTPLSPLLHHVTFGPPAVVMAAGQTLITPIQPLYHASLFPDAPGAQLSLLAPRPHGNALRKAYLCRANIRSAEPGATLLFYRSDDLQAVTTVGVLESSLVSADAEEIIGFVGSRTVYSADEVRQMTRAGPVLALLFRQDRFLEPPITLDELTNARAVTGAPQTTITIRPEGIPWLTARIGA